MSALTHQELDWLMERYRKGAMLFGSEEHSEFVEAAVEYVPKLVEAVRPTIPGEVLLTVKIPGLVPRGTLNSREYWAARVRRVRKEHSQVSLALKLWEAKNGSPPPMPWVVILTRRSPGKMDDDNAFGAMKGVRDALARWVGVDDGDDGFTWLYRLVRCDRKTAGTVIEIQRRPY